MLYYMYICNYTLRNVINKERTRVKEKLLVSFSLSQTDYYIIFHENNTLLLTIYQGAFTTSIITKQTKLVCLNVYLLNVFKLPH